MSRHLPEELRPVVARLEAIATMMELAGAGADRGPDLGLDGVLEVPATVGASATYRLRMVAHPDAVRDRAQRLKKAAGWCADGRTDSAREAARASQGKPMEGSVAACIQRRRYDPALAQEFIDCGELANWQEYRRLHGKDPDLNRYAAHA